MCPASGKGRGRERALPLDRQGSKTTHPATVSLAASRWQHLRSYSGWALGPEVFRSAPFVPALGETLGLCAHSAISCQFLWTSLSPPTQISAELSHPVTIFAEPQPCHPGKGLWTEAPARGPASPRKPDVWGQLLDIRGSMPTHTRDPVNTRSYYVPVST